MIKLVILIATTFGKILAEPKIDKLQEVTHSCKLGLNRYKNPKLMYFNDTCYDKKISDDLPLLERTTIPENSIFFIETSCNGGLHIRQACSIESAAKAHPHRKVFVLFVGPVPRKNLNTKRMCALSRYPNIQLLRIHVNEYLKNSPLETAAHCLFSQSPHPFHHMSDVLRYLTLYKFGGTYLDLDVIVAKPLDLLPNSKNWVGVEDHEKGSVCAALIDVSNDETGKVFIQEVIRIFAEKHDPHSWNQNGNGMIKDALKDICGPYFDKKLKKKISFNCKGITVYESKYFYPVHYQDSYGYFESWLDFRELLNSFAYHTYNFMTKNEEITKWSIYADLMKVFCPRVLFQTIAS